jgi:hypothetical protein
LKEKAVDEVVDEVVEEVVSPLAGILDWIRRSLCGVWRCTDEELLLCRNTSFFSSSFRLDLEEMT